MFLDVRVIPGERSILLGCKSKGVLTYNPEILENRLNTDNIKNKWVTHPYIHYKLSSDRINFTLNSLSDEAEINKDLKPIGYYYYTIFWTSITDSDIKPLLRIEFWLLTVFILGMLLFISLRKRTSDISTLLAIFTTGLAGMVFEITVLLAFQSVYGYLYYKIAIIIATFMLGLALGAFLMNRYMTRIKNNTVTLAGIEFLIVTYSLILPAVIIGISQYLEIIFLLLMIIAGFLTGFEFPLASKIYLERNRDAAKTAGVIYGSDVIGAFLGSVVSASLLIPLIGIINTCILVAILNFITGVLALRI
ncbi:MAG TPA: hypothetical protein EYP86_02560 [Candidatus Altiarchaeales archaeon]|nr:hypothetical protein [Candidatus Altiarchaeales archaeon]